MTPSDTGQTQDDIKQGWPALMKSAQDGDSRAYAKLLRQITPVLRAYLMPRLRDEARVDDVVQDVLMAIHTVRHTYAPDQPFERWMYGIARHKMIDAMRRYGRTSGREVTDPGLFETLSGPAANNPERAELRALMKALDKLPKKQRDIVVKTKIEGHSMAETAEQVGMTEAAVKVAAHRAYKQLRTILENDGDR